MYSCYDLERRHCNPTASRDEHSSANFLSSQLTRQETRTLSCFLLRFFLLFVCLFLRQNLSMAFCSLVGLSLIYPHQSGFLPGHSTVTQLCFLAPAWQVALERGEHRQVWHVLGGQPTPCFFWNRIREKHFFTLPVVNDNEIVRSRSDSDAEGKSG